jgi:hypothetical protein
MFDTPLSQIPQDDPRLVEFIRANNLLVPPSTENYSLDYPDSDPSIGQSVQVKKLLGNMVLALYKLTNSNYTSSHSNEVRRYPFSLQKNGFFVEAGALDGEARSNTLDLEVSYGWKVLHFPILIYLKLKIPKYRNS